MDEVRNDRRMAYAISLGFVSSVVWLCARPRHTAALLFIEPHDPIGEAELLHVRLHAAVAGAHDHVRLMLAARIFGVALVEPAGVHDGGGGGAERMWYVWWIWKVGGRTPKHDRGVGGVGGLAERVPSVRKEQRSCLWRASLLGHDGRSGVGCAVQPGARWTVTVCAKWVRSDCRRVGRLFECVHLASQACCTNDAATVGVDQCLWCIDVLVVGNSACGKTRLRRLHCLAALESRASQLAAPPLYRIQYPTQ